MQTSINIQPCKLSASERHNKREKALSYVRPELSKFNEWYNSLDVHLKAYDARLRKLIKEKTDRACQAKSHPLHEAVVVIRPDTGMADIKRLADAMSKRWGFHFVQLAVHKDEGSWKDGVWKTNYHAHMVFDKIDHTTGKTIKTTAKDTAEMQDMCAVILGMARGKKSDKKHLSALDFKIKAQEEQSKTLAAKNDFLLEAGKKRLDEIAELKQEQEKTAKEVEKMRSTLSFERGRVDYRQKQLEGLKREISSLQGLKDSLNDDIDEKISQLNEKQSEVEKAIKAKQEAEQSKDTIAAEAQSYADVVQSARSDIHELESRKSGLQNELLKLAQEKNKRIAEIAGLPQDVQRTNSMLWDFIYDIWDGIREAVNVLCKYLSYPHLNVSFGYEETKAINNAMKNAQGIDGRKAYGKQIVDLAHAIYPGYSDDSSKLWEISREVERVADYTNRWFQKQDQSQSRGY